MTDPNIKMTMYVGTYYRAVFHIHHGIVIAFIAHLYNQELMIFTKRVSKDLYDYIKLLHKVKRLTSA